MEALFRIPQGDLCATNQVYYNLGGRRIERDLLPWCELHSMPVMAAPALACWLIPYLAVLPQHMLAPLPLLQAWTIRSGNVIAIPESGSVALKCLPLAKS
jgi:diketogulonate reductase-like aldo/keto reductase